ncbi:MULTISPECIES: hypothetical protein [unclassified Polaribacter]|uniref:hypothetical protein n=1 Tax=unclassified Polaribacter TaxID=196858 RepID=UPI0011BF9085|nr:MULTISPECIES: hypothetical protein [unclassified Polaribacter]TXD53157.1 hypothetical protein ES043_05585 [Polaribacter sp. IC063]TXD61277.1 hypothetical protein ES044_05555 [Polaribacter sp. IC066]
MKIWIILILSLSISVIYGQNKQPKKSGIGFAVAENPYLYENLSHPKDIFSNNKLTNKIQTNKIFPYFYKPDYGLYHFICLEKNSKYYKILINNSEIGFIPNNEKYIFKTWETILMSASVERIDKQNLIRNSPKEKDEKIIINSCKYESMKVIDIIEQNGKFWIEISFATNCEAYPENNAERKTGWIKWRNSEKLLVRIQLLC